MKLRLRQLIATVAVVAVSMSLIPKMIGNDAVYADTVKSQTNTCLGTSKIHAPVTPTSTSCVWSGSYVYYGSYKGTPIKFRVLAPSTTVYGSSTLFLDSEDTLFSGYFDKTSPYSKSWADSDIRCILNGTFLTNFTTFEQSAIATSTGNGGLTYNSFLKYLYGSPVSVNDKVFLLDASEVMNPAYGYSSDGGWVDDDGDGDWSTGSWTWHKVINRKKQGSSFCWWLRSGISYYSDYAGEVVNDGNISGYDVYKYYEGVAPALNIDLNKILFSTAINGTMGQVGASYKLTILDNGLSVNAGSVSSSGTTFMCTATGNADRVSLLITDGVWSESGSNIMYYGAYTGSFDLSSISLNVADWGTKYHVYLIAEDTNKDKETDYASTPVEIMEKCTVTFSSNGGSGSMSSMTVSKNDKIKLPEHCSVIRLVVRFCHRISLDSIIK